MLSGCVSHSDHQENKCHRHQQRQQRNMGARLHTAVRSTHKTRETVIDAAAATSFMKHFNLERQILIIHGKQQWPQTLKSLSDRNPRPTGRYLTRKCKRCKNRELYNYLIMAYIQISLDNFMWWSHYMTFNENRSLIDSVFTQLFVCVSWANVGYCEELQLLKYSTD